MHRPILQAAVLIGSVLLPVTGWSTGEAIAQSSPPCQPPSAGEYLLMVINQTPDTQTQLQQILPRNATTTVCDYVGNVVTRVGGFNDLEIANSWAQYLSDIGGMQAFVARPSEAGAAPTVVAPPVPTAAIASPTAAPEPTAPPAPAQTAPVQTAPTQTTQTPRTIAFNPQPLGNGYAVLVDYANRPEVAVDVQQLVSGQVGVVSYEQRPYLLAAYTVDLTTAANVLRSLSDRNLSAIIIDSRKAILLAPDVVND